VPTPAGNKKTTKETLPTLGGKRIPGCIIVPTSGGNKKTVINGVPPHDRKLVPGCKMLPTLVREVSLSAG